MDKYIKQYLEKWENYLKENNITHEDDERTYTWGWQFDVEGFINTPELLLGCYVNNYSCIEEARENLVEHFQNDKESPYYEMSIRALELLDICNK